MVKSEQIVGFVHILDKHRKDIIGTFIIMLCATLLAYWKSYYIINLLSRPLGISLFFITPIEGVMVKIKVSIILGVVFIVPIVLYRIIGLSQHKITRKRLRKIKYILIPFIILSFVGGIIFAYYLVLPTTIQFLISCGNDFMRPNISGEAYFTFTIILLVTIGVIFELPVVLVSLCKLGILNYKQLAAKRKMTIMIIVIVVAIITPTPDAFTLLIVSIPLLLLYEISIWWIYIIERNERKANRLVKDGAEA